MTDYTELGNDYSRRSVFFLVCLFLMAVLLNQSGEVFQVNLSVADFFCIIVFMILILKNQLYIPVIPLMFFLSVSTVVLLSSIFIVPIIFRVDADPIAVTNDYIKLVAIFLYLIIGYNLSRKLKIEYVTKWYSYFGMFLGMLGILLTILNVKIFTDVLFFNGVRYKGLMIDPNYYSVLQITTFVYFSRLKSINISTKFFFLLVTIIAVLISGSKTGTITLVSYLFLRMLEGLVFANKNKIKMVTVFFLLAFFLFISPFLFNMLQTYFFQISLTNPSISRIMYLFTDFNAAISEGGSGRDTTWLAAIQIIKHSPFFGVGVGVYTDIASTNFNSGHVAHNTFLQLLAEWGVPLATIFFIFVLFTICKATFIKKLRTTQNLILRDIVIILLVGSLAISLNNARPLWLFFGALMASIVHLKTSTQSNSKK